MAEALYGGMPGTPLESARPGSARSVASARSDSYSTRGGEDDENLNEHEMLAELASSVPPATLSTLTASVAAGVPCEIELGLSNSRLAVMGRHVELLSGKKMPNLIKQRRDFVLAWWRQALARRAHDDGLAAQVMPTPPSPAKRIEPNPLHMHERRATDAKTALRELLKVYGAPDHMGDGGIELRVPNEHLQIVCSQVEALTGGTVPRQPRAKREWLAEAWAMGQA